MAEWVANVSVLFAAPRRTGSLGRAFRRCEFLFGEWASVRTERSCYPHTPRYMFFGGGS
jgi:hypothetical protein